MTGFLDTNILVHAFESSPSHRFIALGLIGPSNRIAVQSLNEFAIVCRRKLRFSWSDVRLAIESLRGLSVEPPIDLTLAIHLEGLRLAERYQLQLYDSMLLAAALHARCDTFWSEDMHDGLVIDSRLTIRNPFA